MSELVQTRVPDTLILALLDESGSMGPKRADVIGGLNQFLAEQRKLPGACRLTLLTFNTEVTERTPGGPLGLAAMPDLTEATYLPGGNTALFDAIAQAVRIADKHKAQGERVLCLVMTDGEENSSRETTYDQVREIIAARQAGGEWTFAYIGVNPDKWARQMGLPAHNALGYVAGDPGASFLAASEATSAFRASGGRASRTFFGRREERD